MKTEQKPVDTITLNDDERRLLRTYLTGPRIWDAAAVFAEVLRLEARGMLAPTDNTGTRYELTALGRQHATCAHVAHPHIDGSVPDCPGCQPVR